MAKIIRIEQDQQARFVGDEVQILATRSSNALVPRGGSIGQELIEDDTNRNILASVALGAMDTAGELLAAYPQSLGAAVKYRLLAEFGVRPPETKYAPVLTKREKSIVGREAKEDVAMVINKRKPGFSITRLIPGSQDNSQERLKAEVVKELTEQRLAELAEANKYHTEVQKVISQFKMKKSDPDVLLRAALSVVGSDTERLRQAFVAGQMIYSDPEIKPTDLERDIAAICVAAERASGKVWNEQERKDWALRYVREMAREVVVTIGDDLIDVHQHDTLKSLTVPDNAVDEETGIRTLLDVPVADITLAEALGADKGQEGMNFGVKVELGPGNRVLAKFLAKRELVAASPSTVDTGVAMPKSSALLHRVVSGDFGGKNWRKLIHKILGDEINRLPLVGNLVVGSTTRGSENDIVIPMLNPDMGEQILLQAKKATEAIEETIEDIESKNDLLKYRRSSLPAIVTQRAESGMRSLPNASKIATVAGEGVQMVSPDLDSVQIFSEAEVGDNTNHFEVDGGVVFRTSVEDAIARVMVRDVRSARDYVNNHRKGIKKITSLVPAENGHGVNWRCVKVVDERARLLIDEAEKNKKR